MATPEALKEASSLATPEKLKEKLNNNNVEVKVNMGEFKHVFLVMSLGQLDCKELLNGVPGTQLGEDEVTCILYN